MRHHKSLGGEPAEAALDVHDRLRSDELRVRVGINSGEVSVCVGADGVFPTENADQAWFARLAAPQTTKNPHKRLLMRVRVCPLWWALRDSTRTLALLDEFDNLPKAEVIGLGFVYGYIL